MSDRDRPLRAQVIAICQALDAAGMVPNKSGRVSCRSAGGFLITPAGVPYSVLTPREIVELAVDGGPAADGPRPSSEWRMHAAIYARRADAVAIVHTHSPRATALACAGRGIPPFHYMIALAGGDIRCMLYAGRSAALRNLFVVAFDYELKAEQVRLDLLSLKRSHLVDVEEAVVVIVSPEPSGYHGCVQMQPSGGRDKKYKGVQT